MLYDTVNDAQTWQLWHHAWIFTDGTKETENKNPHVWKYPLNLERLGESGVVTRVIDGDTIEVSGIGRIRLADIDTPEKYEEDTKNRRDLLRI